jgi:hypothetical protein
MDLSHLFEEESSPQIESVLSIPEGFCLSVNRESISSNLTILKELQVSLNNDGTVNVKVQENLIKLINGFIT